MLLVVLAIDLSVSHVSLRRSKKILEGMKGSLRNENQSHQITSVVWWVEGEAVNHWVCCGLRFGFKCERLVLWSRYKSKSAMETGSFRNVSRFYRVIY